MSALLMIVSRTYRTRMLRARRTPDGTFGITKQKPPPSIIHQKDKNDSSSGVASSSQGA